LLDQSFKVDLGMYCPLALGMVFPVWGVAARNIGPLTPGGILTDIGVE
jgi:hypothetical protein